MGVEGKDGAGKVHTPRTIYWVPTRTKTHLSGTTYLSISHIRVPQRGITVRLLTAAWRFGTTARNRTSGITTESRSKLKKAEV